jgi:hypothetical protein
LIDTQVAFTVVKLSLQNKLDYLFSNLTSDITDQFVSEIDDSISECFKISIGGINQDAEQFYEGIDENFNYDRLTSGCKHGGGGQRRYKHRYSFINCLNNTLPLISKTWKSLQPIVGTFDDLQESGKWDTLIKSGSRIGAELLKAIQGIKDRCNDLIRQCEQRNIAIDLDRIATISADADNFGANLPKKLSSIVCSEFNYLELKLLLDRAQNLPVTDPRRISLLNCYNDRLSNSIFTALPTEKVIFNSIEFKESACCHLGLPSPSLIPLKGQPITSSNHYTFVDEFGYNLKTVTGVAGGHRTIFHNEIHSAVADSAYRAGIPMKGKPPETCSNLFNDCINIPDSNLELDRITQGIIPDILIKANGSTDGMEEPPTMFDDIDTLLDVKTLGPGLAYKRGTRNTSDNLNPVEYRQEEVNKQYHAKALSIDHKYNNTPRGEKGRVSHRLDSYGRDGKVAGLVFGAFGEGSSHVYQLAAYISKRTALNESQYTLDSVLDRKSLRARAEKNLIKVWGLTVHRGWARLLVDRAALLIRKQSNVQEDVQDPYAEEDDLLFQEDLLYQEHK